MCKDFIPQYRCGHAGKASTKRCFYQEVLEEEARRATPMLSEMTVKQNNLECDARYAVEYERLESTNCPECHRINGEELQEQEEVREEREREWAMERLERARGKEKERVESERKRWEKERQRRGMGNDQRADTLWRRGPGQR